MTNVVEAIMNSKITKLLGNAVLIMAIVAVGVFTSPGPDAEGRELQTQAAPAIAQAVETPEEVVTEVLSDVLNSGAESFVETVQEAAAQAASESAEASRSLQTGPAFTGDAEVDFDPATNPDVVVIVDPGGNDDVGVPASLTGVTSGLDIRDIRYFYQASTDELFFAINYNGIGGDPDGDGNVATGPVLDPANPGNDFGNDEAMWLGESFALILDVNGDNIGDVIAGVSETNLISDFVVADATPLTTLLPGNDLAYGAPIPNAIGLAPTDTSAARPDIEFSIANFSNLIDPAQPNLGISAFTGSGAIEGFGNDSLPSPGQFDTVDNPTLQTAEPSIDIETSTNGIDADLPAQGPQLVVGETATIEHVVTNDGTVDLVDVTVTDENGTVVGVIPSLPVGASESLTTSVVVVPGQTANSGEASGFQDDGTGNPTGPAVTDTDPTHHNAEEVVEPPAPGIDVEKTLFGQDLDDPNGADIPTFAVGSTITFDFEVINTGNTTLVDIALVDDVLGPIACPRTELGEGESMTCSGSTVVTEGQTTNTASASAQPVDADGNPLGDPVTDDDPANHIGATSTLTIEKSTNGVDADDPTGPRISIGDDVIFRYVVTNSGPVDVADVVVTDNVEGFICELSLLPAGTSQTCRFETTATLGQYANVGDVVGQPVDENGNPVGDELTASDPSHHIGVCTNFVEGPALFRGSQTIWNTNLVAGDNSTIVLTTTENGDSPNQPNEQVYVEVAGVLYGPSPVGLGTITLDIAEGGPVTVLHISEVEDGLFSANSVVPSLCGDDLEEFVPVCSALVEGPLLLRQGQTVWNTGLIAGDNSNIRVVTSENGGSPNQPNEQVYVQVGDDVFGPTPAGLGEIEFAITNGGPVTVLHVSEVEEGLFNQNSVIPSLCGDDLVAPSGPVCPTTVQGPRLIQGGQTSWVAGLIANAGSELTIVTSDDASDFRQPNEQVFVRIGDDVYGPTPVGLGEFTLGVENTGAVTVVHYSIIEGRQDSVNSVEFAICGTGLTRTTEGN